MSPDPLPGQRDDPHDPPLIPGARGEEWQMWQEERDEAAAAALSIRATLIRGAAIVAVLVLIYGAVT
jgi:hypothetical protein